MIVSGRPEHVPRKLERTWVKSGNEFGATPDTIKAEFQAIGLKSIRTSYEKQDGTIITDKYLFECGEADCKFAARIVLSRSPNSTPFVEISGITFTNSRIK